jgi:hypothetical protein
MSVITDGLVGQWLMILCLCHSAVSPPQQAASAICVTPWLPAVACLFLLPVRCLGHEYHRCEVNAAALTVVGL